MNNPKGPYLERVKEFPFAIYYSVAKKISIFGTRKIVGLADAC